MCNVHKIYKFEKVSRDGIKNKQVVSSNQLDIAMYSYNAPACNFKLNHVAKCMYKWNIL